MTEKITILSPVASYRHPFNAHAIQTLHEYFDIELIQVHGRSDVTAARNEVATLAYPRIKERGGLVLWLDADMTIKDLATFKLHIQLTKMSGRAISGRAVTRNDHTKVACTIDPCEDRDPEECLLDTSGLLARLTPIVPGLACLMMPAELWLNQADDRPVKLEKGEIVTRYVCCPYVLDGESPEEGSEYVSEDNAYCMSIEGGAWYAAITDTFNETNYLDYGHIAERILMHSQSAHSMEGN
jgi:hypothetical protein